MLTSLFDYTMLVRWLALLFPIGTNCQTGQRRVVLYTATDPRTATAGLVHARYFEQYNAVEAKRRGGIDENDVAGTWHAQMQQDRVIARIFEDKRDGFFVDLAAHTPVDLSNTRTLERDFGWHGVCIEADHAYFVDLARYRACSVVQAVVASRANATVLYRHQASFGGVKRFEEGRRLGSHTPRVTGTSKLRTVTLTNILRHAGAPSTIDYLSLDVEGFESEVLLGFDLHGAYTIHAMTIERPDNALQDKLLAAGYLRGKHPAFRFGDTQRSIHSNPTLFGISLVVGRRSPSFCRTALRWSIISELMHLFSLRGRPLCVFEDPRRCGGGLRPGGL